MSQTRLSFLAKTLLCSLFLSAMCATAQSQNTPAADAKLSLKATLVLTPEFCATKTKKGTWGINQEGFEVGNAVCAELEPALKSVFPGLTRVASAPAPEDQQVVLVPKFMDVAATQAKLAFSNRELVVVLEWTVKDKAGKTVWIETVQGSAKHHMGNAFTYKKNLKLVVGDAAKDLAEQSSKKMSASPELRHLDHVDTTSAFDKKDK